MINLLPPQYKIKVEKEYKFRIASAYILLISIAIFIGVVLLLPSYFFVRAQTSIVENELATLQSSSESTEREAINEKLLETKERLRDLTVIEDKKPLFELIDTVSFHKSNAIDISTLSYVRVTKDGSVISIGGVAATRDSLLSFKRALEEDELFEEIVLPVSSLAEEEDINFNIQVKGVF